MEFETNVSECIDNILEPFKGDHELLTKIFLALEKFNPETIRNLEFEVLKGRPEFIHDILVQIIYNYMHNIIINDLEINNIPVYELESGEYSIELKKISEEETV